MTVSIMGQASITADRMAAFLLAINSSPQISCSAVELTGYYLSEGATEGVRGDIAFCQAIHETGWFRFGGDVLPEQNNFCGLGATNTTPTGKGAWFETAQLGVRAQIQHLKAYASTDALVNECVDPRFSLVIRGIAPTWTDLNGRWAVPGTTYGQSILAIYEQLAGTEEGGNDMEHAVVYYTDKDFSLVRIVSDQLGGCAMFCRNATATIHPEALAATQIIVK